MSTVKTVDNSPKENRSGQAEIEAYEKFVVFVGFLMAERTLRIYTIGLK